VCPFPRNRGVAFAVLFPRYEIGAGLVQPANSPHSAPELVIMTRDDHPGVIVDGRGRFIEFSATSGSLSGRWRAVNQATRAVVAANNGNVKATHGFAAQLPLAGLYGLFGFLAGLGTALGFLLPLRSRVTAELRRC
jgi:hypothetical protein